jgi:hypothetical protein
VGSLRCGDCVCVPPEGLRAPRRARGIQSADTARIYRRATTCTHTHVLHISTVAWMRVRQWSRRRVCGRRRTGLLRVRQRRGAATAPARPAIAVSTVPLAFVASGSRLGLGGAANGGTNAARAALGGWECPDVDGRMQSPRAQRERRIRVRTMDARCVLVGRTLRRSLQLLPNQRDA